MACPAEGPDFICVGMPRAGTDWLFDQLQYHPDFWMPPVKEIAYLVHKFPKLKHVNAHFGRVQNGAPRRRSNKRPGDERDRLFVEEAARLTQQARNVEAYARLFRYKNGLLSGDISPGYCRLPKGAIEGVAAALPDTKIIFLVRDPVARAWSHLSMLYHSGKLEGDVIQQPDALRAYLEDVRNIERRSLASETARHWKKWAPNVAFRHFFFDDIVAQPAQARREILEFIGADPEKSSGDLPPGYNRKGGREKRPLTEPIKAVLKRHFSGETRACADEFGGHAAAWAAR